jgi:hypothetical protein
MLTANSVGGEQARDSRVHLIVPIAGDERSGGKLPLFEA